MTVRSCIDARHLHGLYTSLVAKAEAGNGNAGDIKYLIDKASQAVIDTIKEGGYFADPSDAAEEVVGVITGYFLNSNPSFRALFPPPLVVVEIVEGRGADEVARYGWRIQGEPDSELSDLFGDEDAAEQDARDTLGAGQIERFDYIGG